MSSVKNGFFIFFTEFYKLSTEFKKLKTNGKFCSILYIENKEEAKMKFFLNIDPSAEPTVTVTCPKVTATVKKIEEICAEAEIDSVLYGIDNDEVIPLTLEQVTCFFTKNNKVYAFVGDKEYLVKQRIKQIMELVDSSFIKINQGCVAKVNQIQKFSVSFGGALKVVFKNGYTDYVSRRETANIKRRFGL